MVLYIVVLVLSILLSYSSEINKEEVVFKNESIFPSLFRNPGEIKQIKDVRQSGTTAYDPTPTTVYDPTPDWTTPEITCPETSYDTHSQWNITFPETHVGSQATSLELCTCNDTPIVMDCLDNGTWSGLERGCCYDPMTSTTWELQTIFEYVYSDNYYVNTSFLEQLNIITENQTNDFSVVDIHIMSRILSAEQSLDYSETFFDIINNIMNINRTILNAAQQLLNTTDTILYSLDQFILNSNTQDVKRPNFIIHTFDTSGGTIGGMMTISTKNDCTTFQLENLYKYDYLDEINAKYFDIAFTMSDAVLTTQDNYTVTIFCSESLFNEEKNHTIGSWITSILLPNETHYTDTAITMYFREFDSYSHQECDYWKYGYENDHPIKGSWSTDGNVSLIKKSFYVCEVNHTTHFAMLVSTAGDSFILDLITIFGSVMSLVGLIIVFLTALIFKQWRKELKTKILLNVSFCLLFLIILFIISDQVDKGTACIVIGILLHFTVLAQFCWILITSYYNYKLYVNFNLKPVNSQFWKFCLLAYGTPIIVVAIVAGINYETYDKISDKNSSQICYPKDLYLKLGVCLPMSIILAMNSILYFKVIISLIGKKKDFIRENQANSYVIEKHLVLFFFTMGVTWLFGVLAAFTNFVVFVYLFCTLVTFHGFMLFVVHIWEDKRVKEKWRILITRLFKKNPTQRFENQSSTEMDDGFSRFKSEGR